MDTAIKKANEIIVNVAQNKDMLRLYHLHEKALSDYASGIDDAEGRGRREGKQEMLMNIVLNLQSNGFSIEDIAKFTKISSDEVRSIFKAQGLA
jgi:predicted transposase/invertase (TIGR01784 family)